MAVSECVVVNGSFTGYFCLYVLVVARRSYVWVNGNFFGRALSQAVLSPCWCMWNFNIASFLFRCVLFSFHRLLFSGVRSLVAALSLVVRLESLFVALPVSAVFFDVCVFMLEVFVVEASSCLLR